MRVGLRQYCHRDPHLNVEEIDSRLKFSTHFNAGQRVRKACDFFCYAFCIRLFSNGVRAPAIPTQPWQKANPQRGDFIVETILRIIHIFSFVSHDESPLDHNCRLPLRRDCGHPPVALAVSLKQDVEQAVQVEIPAGSPRTAHLLLLRPGRNSDPLLLG